MNENKFKYKRIIKQSQRGPSLGRKAMPPSGRALCSLYSESILAMPFYLHTGAHPMTRTAVEACKTSQIQIIESWNNLCWKVLLKSPTPTPKIPRAVQHRMVFHCHAECNVCTGCTLKSPPRMTAYRPDEKLFHSQ